MCQRLTLKTFTPQTLYVILTWKQIMKTALIILFVAYLQNVCVMMSQWTEV